MKHNYLKKNLKTSWSLLWTVVLTLCTGLLHAQQSYTFTPCGATGMAGPTQTQVNNTYSATNLNGLVTATNGIQTWTVPYTGNFRIEAKGAQGGGSGGTGATMVGDFSLTVGEVIRILVGQEGEAGGSGPGGGGGGSFVVRTPYTTTASILIIAGGGSGNGNYSFTSGVNTTAGVTGGVAGGTNGSGGLGGTRGGGGGGFLTDGGPCTGNTIYASPGVAFVNGGAGGVPTNNCSFTAAGGFGGGSSHGGNCINNGGAGGGFSGGGGSSNTTSGGGGSYNAGTNQTNTSGNNTGNGRVVITELCSIQIYASGSNSVNPIICSGNSLTLTTNAVSGYSWSTGQTTNSIVVSPTTNTLYSLSGTSSLSCNTSASMSVTVSSAVPSLSIANTSTTVCLGITVSLTASGANTYTWSNPGVVNGQTFTPSATAIYTVNGQNGCGITTATTGITVAPIAVSIVANPTLVCEGSTTTLTATAPVSGFTWSPSSAQGSVVTLVTFSNTIYTVSASDGTCAGTQTVAINTKVSPTISASASSSLMCEGGQVTITASGANTYTWMPGNVSGNSITVSPATSTLYTVIGENTLGCSGNSQQIVLVQPSPTINVTASQTLVCANESATLDVTGGDSYVWTGGPSTSQYIVSPSSTTSYTVVASHNLNVCTATQSIAVAVLVPSLTLPTNTQVCIGGSVTVYASGADDYTWNSISSGSVGVYGLQPPSTTTVTLIATTQSLTLSCPTTHTFEVLVNPLPTLTVVPTRSVMCRFETNTLTVTGAQTYSWTSTATGSTFVINPSTTTVYSVSGTDINGCENSLMYQQIASSCNGIEESYLNTAQLTIYPNPNNGAFTLKSDVSLDLILVNELGQQLNHFKLQESNGYQFEFNDLKPGVYFILNQKVSGTSAKKIVVH